MSYHQPDPPREAISEGFDAVFRHFNLGLPTAPYRANVARRVADEIIAKYC